MRIHLPIPKHRVHPTQPALKDISDELRSIQKRIDHVLVMLYAKNATVSEQVLLTEKMRERVREIFGIILPWHRWMEAILYLNEYKDTAVQALLFDEYIAEYHKTAKNLMRAERRWRHDFEEFGLLVSKKDYVRVHVYHFTTLMMDEAKIRVLGLFNTLMNPEEQMVCLWAALNRFSSQMRAALAEDDDIDDDDDDLNMFFDEEDDDDCEQEESSSSPASEDSVELSQEEEDEIAADLRRRISQILREMNENNEE